MSLKAANTDILMQLAEVVSQLNDADYARPLPVISENTIGKHVRHILEFYELLVAGSQTSHLNYDRRQRDSRLETDPDEALRRISLIDRAIHHLDLQQLLYMETDLSAEGAEPVGVPSSVARELLYNIEHAIHHMALIQVAVRDSFPAVELPAYFGVAWSTVQHQNR